MAVPRGVRLDPRGCSIGRESAVADGATRGGIAAEVPSTLTSADQRLDLLGNWLMDLALDTFRNLPSVENRQAATPVAIGVEA